MAASRKKTRKQTTNPAPIGTAEAGAAGTPGKRTAKPKATPKPKPAAKPGPVAKAARPKAPAKRGSRRSAAAEAPAPTGRTVKTATGKSLVIVESPTKSRTLTKFLGRVVRVATDVAAAGPAR